MKVLAIGDPHGDLEKIKKIPLKNIDLILLTGDLGSANLMRKMHFDNIERKKRGLPIKQYSSNDQKKAFMEAYTSTIKLVRYLSNFAPVYTIFGNVESSNSETKKLSKKISSTLPYLLDNLNLIKGVKVINNKVITFRGFRIGGLEYFLDTNWVRDFKPSDFDKKMLQAIGETTKAKKILEGFKVLDLLICHQPPYKILDKVTSPSAPKSWIGKNAGSEIIKKYIQLKKPKYVFCGHIHEAQGEKKVGITRIYNLGVCNYKIIDLKL